MKAAVLYSPKKLSIEERPVPAVKRDEILIKVELCGVCGTDFLVYDGRFPVEYPYYNFGHEYIGTVEKTGESVKTIVVGDRVVTNPNYHCDCCYYCKRGELEFCENRRVFKTKSNGGFAEFAAVSEKLVCKVGETLSAEEAIFAEPLSCCIHAIEKINFRVDDDVLVFGCGTMGLLILQLCRLNGVSTIIAVEPVPNRRKLAKQLGADVVINPLEDDLWEVISKTSSRGPRVVIESAGAKGTISQSLEVISKKGQLLLLALWDKRLQTAISPHLIVDKELSIAGAIFGSLTFKRAVDILDANKIETAALLTDV